MLTGSTYCCEALHSYCNLRIYSATQGYSVVLFCIMINVEVEGCIMPLKGGGGEEHIGVRIRGVYSTM